MAISRPTPDPIPTQFDGLTAQETSYARLVLRRFLRNRMAVAGATIFLILILISAFAPVITQATLGWGRDEIDIQYIRAAPSARHPLGTDSAGRDNLTRLLYGGRVSLSIALGSVIVYMVLGIVIGSVAGYFGGWIDNVLMRLVDVIQSFPFLMFALTIVAIRGPSVSNLVFAIVFLSWPVPARLVRGEFLSLRERDFIEAARAAGVGTFRMIVRHLLPNAMAPLIVNATLEVAGIILAEAGLSYLGFGVNQPVPTWGNMLSEANNMAVLQTRPWTWIPPGLMIFLTVLSINFIGDGLRDALDPRLKQ